MKFNVKIASIIFLFFILTSFHAEGVQKNNEPAYKLKTVVIDPGHGGYDQGCSGKNSLEKNIALAVALKLGAMIEKNYPDVKVIYTRKTDVFVELYERAAIANRNNADLFICIHCNANPSSVPSGTETYVMGLHKTEANLAVAKRENDVVLMEENYTQNYDGFNPNDPSAHIIFSLFQQAYMQQSILFASKCEEQFKKNSNRPSRGVKQAGFLVLWKTTMPSVLIETGFLTNSKEEQLLKSDTGQSKIAQSIFNAFASYKNEMENTGGQVDEKEMALLSSQVDKEDAKDDTSVQNENILAVKTDNSKTAEAKTDITYYVQYYAAKEEIKITDKKFSAIKTEKISYTKENGWYKYRTGPYITLQIATAKQATIRKAGYKDAFVLALKNGERISLSEADNVKRNP